MNISALSFTAAALLCAVACIDNLKAGTVDLGPDTDDPTPSEPAFKYPDSYTLNHPCAYVTGKDIDKVKAAVSKADGNDPVYAAWKTFEANTYSSSRCHQSAVPVLVRGDISGTGVSSENYITACQAAASAFQQALRWRITGDTSFADAAVSQLNEWASVCTKITANDNNQYLLAGFQGCQFANAAELLRDYPGWSAADQTKFKKWLMEVWYAKNHWFISTHGGSSTCNLHYWSNWELANIGSILAIGIYTDNAELITEAYKEFREGLGSGALHNIVPYDPVADPNGHGMIAQSMESGRDQGHATLVASLSAELCRMAENIGLDFWGMDDERILAMFEYTAKYNCKPDGSFICTSMPFTKYSYCTGCSCSSNSHGAVHTTISADGRGKERACWDLIVSHYGENKAYYSSIFAEQLRYTKGVLTGDGGAGDTRYGTTSAAFDQIGWGTLLFYRK